MSHDERNIFITGNKVLLCSLDELDVSESNWFGWFNDELTTKALQKHYYPNSESQQLDYLRKIRESIEVLQLGVRKISDPDQMVGIVSLQEIDYINRSCEISTVIGEGGARDLATFIEANYLLIRHAFDSLNLNRVSAGTILKEIVDIQCSLLGFCKEGMIREAVFKQGVYFDVYLLGVLKRTFNYDLFK